MQQVCESQFDCFNLDLIAKVQRYKGSTLTFKDIFLKAVILRFIELETEGETDLETLRDHIKSHKDIFDDDDWI